VCSRRVSFFQVHRLPASRCYRLTIGVQCHAALSKLFSDPENLPKTFEEWLELALLAERRFQREGLAVARIVIRPVPFAAWCPVPFAAWCKERNLIPDQRTRLTNEAARYHCSPY
jgi:hypothetical protein